MLNALRINRYRGIRDGRLSDLAHINLLVGPNGSGKSTVLEAIFLGVPHGTPQHEFQSSFGWRQTLIPLRHNESDFPSEEWWFAKDLSQNITITYDFDGTAPLELTFSARKGFPGVNWPQSVGHYFSATRLLDVRLLLDSSVEMRGWDQLLAVRGDRTLKKVLSDVYGLDIESFTYSAKRPALKVLLNDRNYALNVDDLGAGMRIALRIYVSILLSKDGAVLAEEFDGYQHIESFPRFVRVLFELATQNQTQLFLATHSMETIRAFAEEAKSRGGDLLRVYQTSLTPDGKFEAAALTADEASTLVNGGFDVRKTS